MPWGWMPGVMPRHPLRREMSGRGEGGMGRRERESQGDVRGVEAPGLLRRYGLWLLGLGFILLVLLGTVADADLRFSRYFYDPMVSQPWFLKTTAPWLWLYR